MTGFDTDTVGALDATEQEPVRGHDDDASFVTTGLGLSGGGYRAMLFHTGALWRLNELGMLPRIQRYSSVSGGSIVSALLGLRWGRLDFEAATGIANRFLDEIVEPIRRVASTTIDVPAVFLGWAGLSTATWYRWLLYGRATLQDFPDTPRFIVNASNVQSGVLWRFSKPYARDWRVGEIRHPTIPLAVAVAASSAFPPVLSPVILKLRPDRFTPESGDGLQVAPYTSRVVLTDGGVYDNLGLESVWKQCRTVFASDGGMRPAAQPDPATNWVGHMLRIIPLIHNQVASLRRRQLIGSFRSAVGDAHRGGAYWGIGTDIAEYGVPDALPCPAVRTRRLAAVPTRLKRMEPVLQERLINWGYAVCDAAMRANVTPEAAPGRFPYRSSGVG